MRDEDRLREKRQFSLEDGQVWALGFSALLLIGGVFVVGVLVGRRMAPDSRPPAAGYRPPETAVVVPSAPPGVGALPVKAAKNENENENRPKNENENENENENKPRNENQHKNENAQGRAATVIPPPPKAVTVAPAPPPAVQVASLAALTPPPKDLAEFTVQIGASQDRSEAQRMENKARAAGLKPYVVEANLGAKGTWYRVRVGSFKEKDAANRFRADVERELRGPAVVMGTR